MSNIGRTSFLLFLILSLITAGIFCLPQTYGWSWGLVIQIWAVFGFVKLYLIGDPGMADAPHKKLSVRLLDSLKRRLSHESDYIAGRLGRYDSLAVLMAGSLLVLWVLGGAYGGLSDEASVQRALYITLYLAAQIFCLGVIAFLAQLYAAKEEFVLVGFFLCFAVALTTLVYGIARFGLSAVDWGTITFAQGTDIYLLGHAGLSAFMVRLQAMGIGGAILPWLAVVPMAVPLIVQIRHPARRKTVAISALILMALLGFYDVFAVRGHAHFLVILPAWVALVLAWGRTGYGPPWVHPPAFKPAVFLP